ncbi:MAG TPA: prohibitin family protein [Pseudomonadota bacterium]|nr:prohibitin family protein [Pseudomonadota bacterium]
MTSVQVPPPESVVDEAPLDDRPSLRERLYRWLNQLQFVLYTILVLVLLTVGFLWKRMFIVIQPGHRGVMYRTVYGGTVTSRTWSEGLHVIPPWDRMESYDLRLQQKTLDFSVLSDEGLSLGVQVVVRYRPHEEMLGFLQKDIGPNYFDSLIRPEIEAHIRRTFGGRPAHEVYASARDVIQEVGQFPLIGRVDKSSAAGTSQPYVYVQELKLTSLTLPKVVEDAIVEKYREEQLMLAYRYKLEREEKEADRKRTEAAGIRDFNLIAGKVSPDMLRWRGIDAALDLAKSNNSKVIIMGSGSAGPATAMQLNIGDAAGNNPASSETEAASDKKPTDLKPATGKTRAPTAAPAAPTR